MPFYVPRTRFRKVSPPSFRNSFWENWGAAGKYIGSALILFGISLSVIEIVRVLYGPTNRGVSNFDDNDNTQFPNVNAGLLFPVHGPGNFPRRADKMHYWPWTYAANLFGLVAIFAGVAGVISAYRRSYSSLFAFLSLSLLTCLLSGYLIGYYAILVNYYRRVGNNKADNRPDSFDVSWGLIGVNLAFSCASCLFGFLGFLSAFVGLRGCSPKGLQMDNVDPRNQSRVPYTQVPAQNTPMRTANVPTQLVAPPQQRIPLQQPTMFYAPR